MSEYLKIDVYQIMLLLNELFESRQNTLNIYMPYFGDPIFTIALFAENTTKASKVRFNLSFRNYQQKSRGRHLREIPDYNTIQAILLQSGIIEYPNFDEFLKILVQYANRDFLKGDRPVFLGLDTNLFRDLFYSANYSVLKNIPQNTIGFSLSPNVKDELSFDNKKYKNKDLYALAEHARDAEFKSIIYDFFNQPCLHDRLCRLAFSEIEKVKRIHWIELLPELDEKELEATGDLNIIKTYKLASEERNVDILLLSRDDGFIGHAQGIHGIRTFEIETPRYDRKIIDVVRWGKICRLIYLSAVIAGAIAIQSDKEKFYLSGIWKGKRTTDWDKERLLVYRPAQNSPVFEKSWKSLQVLKQANWENIL